MGIYVGPENEEQPKDAAKYEWSKYSGDSNYIDIRYSNDGETFTEDSGRVQGSWMGVFITNNPDVLLETYEPTWKDYNWTDLSAAAGVTTPIYYIETDYKTVAKFFTKDLEYSYVPSTLKIYFKVREADTVGQVSRGYIQVYYTYYSLNDHTNILTSDIITSNTELEFSLTEDIFSERNLQDIVISGIVEGQTLVTEIIQVNYGTTEDMAKLALNAADIVASIAYTKLVFNAKGLTVKNGGLSILNSQDREVFYADKEGNLFFSGTLSTSSGNLGGWKIDDFGLYSDNGTIGLYAGGDLIHPEDTSQSPSSIRFWAGRHIKDNIVNYNFAVNHDGYLFAKQANISGKIISTDGYIQNKFLIGSNNNGIVIFGGNEKTESYIGSAQYSSGTFGYGWKLAQDGTAEFNNITARGKIQSSVFEYNKVSSVGGSLYIAPTIYTETVSGTITSSTQTISEEQTEVTTLTVDWILPYSNLNDINGHKWQIEDEIKLDGQILLEEELIELSNINGVITNAVSNNDNTVTITVSFEIAQNQANKITGSKFQSGAILILYGSEKKRHGLYLTAAGEGSPFMDVYDDSENNIVKPAVRIGNLAGINDINFAQTSLNGYGLYSSNAYLRGQLILPNSGISNQKTVGYSGGDNYLDISQEDQQNAVRIWAGAGYPSTSSEVAPFIVTQDGSLYAKKGIFQGIVKATNGEYSGSIRSAGILLEEPTGTKRTIDHDHLYVAYTILERIQLLKNNILLDEGSFNNFITKSDEEKKTILETCKITDIEEQTEFLNKFNEKAITYKEIDDYFDNWENDHFEPSPYNYVLDIDSKGISIWEGGLRAYSDYASGLEDTTYINPIYGYDLTQANPQPFFSLADDGEGNELHARIVAHKGHFLTINQNGTSYNTNSIIFDNGIWFDSDNYNNINGIEKTAYYQSSHSNGLSLKNNLLNLNNDYGLSLTSKETIYINPIETDIDSTRAEKVLIRGQLNLIKESEELDNLISLNGQVIKEAFNSNKSIGIDIIVS